MKGLRYTLRFFDHIRVVTLTHFELHDDLRYVVETNDEQTYQSYLKDLLLIRPSYDQYSEEQKYLHSLSALVEPVISAHRLLNRLHRLRPRTRTVNASSRLEDCVRQLAMESYHFKERMCLFGNNVSSLANEPELA